jgi:preprotein translocase subunit SecG
MISRAVRRKHVVAPPGAAATVPQAAGTGIGAARALESAIMITVVIVIHLMLAVALIGTVLVQKSEGGALGMGGGGMSGFMSGRSTANLLTRTTAILAACFFATSIALALLASSQRASHSIIDTGRSPAGQSAPAGNAPAGNASPAPLAPSQLPAPQGPAAPSTPAAPLAK